MSKMDMDMKKILTTIFSAIIVLTILGFAFGTILMWLWNWLIPVLFNGPTITFWQSIGLSLLSSVLFGQKPVYKNYDDVLNDDI